MKHQPGNGWGCYWIAGCTWIYFALSTALDIMSLSVDCHRFLLPFAVTVLPTVVESRMLLLVLPQMTHTPGRAPPSMRDYHLT
jgi:hypothetical protein